MSRPSGPANQSPTGDHIPHRLAQPTPHGSPSHPHAGAHPSQHNSPRDGGHHGQLSLPPLRQLSDTPPSSERRAGNPLGMHSILNPQAELLEQQRDRRRSASQMDLPSPGDNTSHPSLPSISRPTSVDSTQGDMMPSRQFPPPPSRPRGRGPLSPTVHRSQSLSMLNPPTGTIDAHVVPFLSPSGRTSGPDQVTSQPALPTPPVGHRVTYFHTVPPTAPTPPPSMVRNELRRPSLSFPQSGSASPIAAFSPYSQPASVSSSQYEASSQQGPYMSVPTNASMSEPHHIPVTMDMDRNGRIPMAPTGQSSIQIMTIKSQQGHHVQIPVDVQAASKVADEKRKRNAGASARFRARRKEKEREASINIARLEQQLREALEDIDYYRTERNYFKSIVFQQPGAEQHYARPPSPQVRRLSVAPSNAASSTTGGGSADSPYSAYEDDVRETERNVRRRTSTYHPSLGQIDSPLNGTGPSPSGYPTPSFSSVNTISNGATPNGPHQQQQPRAFDLHEPRQRSEHQPLSSHRPSYGSEQGRYEQRNWASGPGSARDTR